MEIEWDLCGEELGLRRGWKGYKMEVGWRWRWG